MTVQRSWIIGLWLSCSACSAGGQTGDEPTDVYEDDVVAPESSHSTVDFGPFEETPVTSRLQLQYREPTADEAFSFLTYRVAAQPSAQQRFKLEIEFPIDRFPVSLRVERDRGVYLRLEHWSGEQFEEWFALDGTLAGSRVGSDRVRIDMAEIRLSTNPDVLEIVQYVDPMDGFVEGVLEVACMARSPSNGAPTAEDGSVAQPAWPWMVDDEWSTPFCQRMKATQELLPSAGTNP